MSWIPCTSACVYQSDGECTLESAAAVGMPMHGGACIHYIPAYPPISHISAVHPEPHGLPHRYSAPGEVQVRDKFPDVPSHAPEEHSV